MDECMNSPKTRIAIEEAFLSLLAENPFEDITMNDILEATGETQERVDSIYPTKRSIIIGFLDRLSDTVSTKIISNLDDALINENNLKRILDFYEPYRTELLSIEGAGLSDILFDHALMLTEDLLAHTSAAEVDTVKYRYITGGIFSTFMGWLTDEHHSDTQTFAKQQIKFIANDLKLDM